MMILKMKFLAMVVASTWVASHAGDPSSRLGPPGKPTIGSARETLELLDHGMAMIAAPTSADGSMMGKGTKRPWKPAKFVLSLQALSRKRGWNMAAPTKGSVQLGGEDGALDANAVDAKPLEDVTIQRQQFIKDTFEDETMPGNTDPAAVKKAVLEEKRKRAERARQYQTGELPVDFDQIDYNNDGAMLPAGGGSRGSTNAPGMGLGEVKLPPMPRQKGLRPVSVVKELPPPVQAPPPVPAPPPPRPHANGLVRHHIPLTVPLIK